MLAIHLTCCRYIGHQNAVAGTRVNIGYFTKRTCADVCICPECRETVGGHSYMGDVDTTVSGRTCQAWTLDYPHGHQYDSDSMYPDGSISATGNKCRNPDSNYHEGVWCYTTDPNTRWELCDVPLCPEEGECIYLGILRLSNTLS